MYSLELKPKIHLSFPGFSRFIEFKIGDDAHIDCTQSSTKLLKPLQPV